MIQSRLLTIPLMCVSLGAPLFSVDLSSYRGIQFGMNLSTAAKQAGTNLAEARTLHQRPAVIQEMDWQPRPPIMANPAKADPVKDGQLYFVNGELFRIVVTYDRYKVQGMTAEDMIDGISATYGTATRPMAEIAYHSNYGEVATVLARWEDSQYAYNLVRTGDQTSFAMILYSKTLEASAQAAIAESARLDLLEAPQREIEKQKKRDQDERNVLDLARSVNKLNFRP
jgi:hypothetical protein